MVRKMSEVVLSLILLITATGFMPVSGCNSNDQDGDGYTSEASGGDDCNDTDSTIHPDATEVCDQVDQDCDGRVDEDFDQDYDGWSSCQGDCDDTNPDMHPNFAEVCDGIDNNCDGQVDEPPAAPDADGDGYSTCPFVEVDVDCNDADPTIHPGAPEMCNSKDDDCDGTIDEGCRTSP